MKVGVDSKSVLDIGCGVGGLHLTLLRNGARLAQGVDVSAGMLAAAKSLAEELGLGEKVTYHCGDFIERNGEISNADIVVLDKVICCHPDPTRLIKKSGYCARSLLAVSYPRDSFLARFVFEVPSKLGELLRWSFRPYYHETSLIEREIEKCGFSEVFSSNTIIWQMKIYQKNC